MRWSLIFATLAAIAALMAAWNGFGRGIGNGEFIVYAASALVLGAIATGFETQQTRMREGRHTAIGNRRHGELREDHQITHTGIERIQETLERVHGRGIGPSLPASTPQFYTHPHVAYQVLSGPAASASASYLHRTAWRLRVSNTGTGAGRYTVSLDVQEPKGKFIQFEPGSHYLPWKGNPTRVVEIMGGQSDVLDVGFLEHDASGVLKSAGLWFRYDHQPAQFCWFASADDNPDGLRADFTVTVSTEPPMWFGPALPLPFYLDSSGMHQIKPTVELDPTAPDYSQRLQQALLANNPHRTTAS